MLQMKTDPIIKSPIAIFNQGRHEDGAEGQFEDAPEELEAALATADVKNHQNVSGILIASPTDGIGEISPHETHLDNENDMQENAVYEASDHKKISPKKDYEATRTYKDGSSAKNGQPSSGFFDSEIREQDVLFGRGSRTNYHAGNKYFRSLVSSARLQYAATPKMHKSSIARAIIFKIKRRSGRFLKKDEKTGRWIEVCDKKARLKTSQALREGLAHKTRQALQLSNENIQSQP